MKRSKIIEQALKETFDELNSLVYLCKVRLSNSFIRKVNNVKNDDEIVSFKFKKKHYKIRVIKIMLDSGIEEILVSSSLNQDFTKADF